MYYFQDFPIGNEYLFEEGKVAKIINHDENYKISIENVRKIILQTFDVDIFFYRRTPYYIEVTRKKKGGLSDRLAICIYCKIRSNVGRRISK